MIFSGLHFLRITRKVVLILLNSLGIQVKTSAFEEYDVGGNVWITKKIQV